MLKVTTSWDDGDVLDTRLSDMLTSYGIAGTFYITETYRPARLSEDEIRSIGTYHEIGAHTLTHPDLRTLSLEEKKREIHGSKEWLEHILNQQISMFCYPKGFYDSETSMVAKEAGFSGARTTRLGSIRVPKDPYTMDTTLQVYPFPFRKIDARKYYWGKLVEPYTQRAHDLRTLGVSPVSMYSWLSLAKATFDVAKKEGSVFHIWGHSWEIEKYGMWDEFEKLLMYIGKREDCAYVTNGNLIE